MGRAPGTVAPVAVVAKRKRPPRLPRIGPCRDPLRLWFLEYRDRRGIWRRYFADRDEARRALAAYRAG